MTERTEKCPTCGTWPMRFDPPLELEVEEEATMLVELHQRVETAEQQVAQIRAFLEDMAGWCSPHGVAADYARRGLDALDGVDPFEAIRAKGQDREDALDAAIAHTALAAIRDYVETSDDTGIRIREHLLGILNEAGVPSVIEEELDGADRYADMVNAPLRPGTIAAIAKRIKAADVPVRKVKLRDAAAEHRWRCDSSGHGPLTSSPQPSAEAAQRAYERHQASEHRGGQR